MRRESFRSAATSSADITTETGAVSRDWRVGRPRGFVPAERAAVADSAGGVAWEPPERLVCLTECER